MEYKPGQKASFSKTITESDVYGFAGLTGDFNPLHVKGQKRCSLESGLLTVC